MTLSISDQPSQWRRLSDHPKRLSLLSDATIDPFPQRVTRSTSLLEHHIVRDPPLDIANRPDDGRRSTVHFPPHRASPLGRFDLHHPHGLPYPVPEHQESHDLLSRKRKESTMADQRPSRSSSPASVGQADGQTQFCLCQPEPKIPRPRNGKHPNTKMPLPTDKVQAFILYRQHQQAAVVRSHPGLPNPAISKIIGEQWSHLPEQEKDKWKALAEVSQRLSTRQKFIVLTTPNRKKRLVMLSSIQSIGISLVETAGIAVSHQVQDHPPVEKSIKTVTVSSVAARP
jgi:HMG (high mobility group) box